MGQGASQTGARDMGQGASLDAQDSLADSPLAPNPLPLEVTINDIDRVKKVNVLGQNMMAFDLVFSANILLPEGIAIGRKVAFGFGFVIGIGG